MGFCYFVQSEYSEKLEEKMTKYKPKKKTRKKYMTNLLSKRWCYQIISCLNETFLETSYCPASVDEERINLKLKSLLELESLNEKTFIVQNYSLRCDESPPRS